MASYVTYAGGTAIALLVVLSGCASDPVEAERPLNLTFAEVREIQNTQLQKFIDLIPEDQVVDVWGPIPKMSAMSCDTDLGGTNPPWKEDTGTYMLPGGADITVQDSLDVPALLNQIAQQQANKGWQHQWQNGGRQKLVLYSEEGFDYYLTYFPGKEDRGPFLGINSFGPCVLPPDDFDVAEKY